MTASTVIAGGAVPGRGLVDVVIEGGRIVDVRPDAAHGGDGERIDASGCWVAPGLIDVQLNGGWGVDFTTDPDAIDIVAAHLPATGVTAFLPTIVTSDAGRREAAIAAVGGAHAGECEAIPVGIHLEGPIINARRSGAHEVRWIGFPDTTELARWSLDAGVRMVTLAPEVDGATELVAELARRGIVVAAGHTACSDAEFAAARRAGLTMVTHLFNAMAPFDHRHPGPIGATLADPEVFASLICDGIHVHPTAVRMAWRALGAARTILVTDATAALGTNGARVRLGGVDVTIDGDRLETQDGALAGSNLTLDRAIRQLIAFTGCSVPDALATVTSTPARLLGLDDRGTIAPGARADIVVLDQQLAVRRTLIGGRTAWSSGQAV